MDNGGIWPADEGYFQNIRETYLQERIEQLTKELADKDKLIEQMREALKFSLIADEVRQTRNVCASDINDACETSDINDACETSRIKRIAALSAADGGEE